MSGSSGRGGVAVVSPTQGSEPLPERQASRPTWRMVGIGTDDEAGDKTGDEASDP
jgi:hypothetical protein